MGRSSNGATKACGPRSRKRWRDSGRAAGSALRSLLPPDRLVALPLLDRAPQERARPGGIGLRALRELRGRAADETAGRAVAAAVEARVAVDAVDLERPGRLEKAHRLGLRDERPDLFGPQHARATGFL